MSDVRTRFAELCREDPNRPLIHLPGLASVISAADIWDAHQRHAQLLARMGVGSGQLVVCAAGNAPDVVSVLLACRAVDAALMPVDAGTTVSEILGLAERFGAVAILMPDTLPRDPRLKSTPSLEIAAGLRLFSAATENPRQYAGAAVLKLTSGSTGMPKAALTTEAQLVADATHIVEAVGIEPMDVQIAAIPMAHAYGLGSLIMPLLMQGTAFVLRDSFVPHQLPADAQRFGARVFPGVPFMFEYFLNNPIVGWPPSLQQLISAGAPLAPATVRAFHQRYGVKIHSFYGATETGGIAFDDRDEIEEDGGVGRPLPGVTITLKHDRGMPAGAGRIHVSSAAVASGYADDGTGRPEGQPDVQRQGPFLAHGMQPGHEHGFTDGGFLTGDYGAWDARRRLMLLGRVSSFVNVAGRKVQPGEVEQVLRTMPGIIDAHVVAAPDARRGQQIVACVVSPRAAGLSTFAVRRFCASRLAPYKIPRTIIFLDAIPLTPRGKIDRAALDDLVRTASSISL